MDSRGNLDSSSGSMQLQGADADLPVARPRWLLIGGVSTAVLVVVGVIGAVVIAGGGSPAPPTPSPTPPPSPSPSPSPSPTPSPPTPGDLYSCNSDIKFSHVARMEDKGLVIDDTSYVSCPEQFLGTWPNTDHKVLMLRTNAPWRGFWPQNKTMRDSTLSSLIDFVKTNHAKVLIGQDATCNETDDDVEWQLNLRFIQAIGEEHILGVAFGNEMDILYQHTDWYQKDFPNCMIDLWDRGQFWDAFQRRVTEMDETLGSKRIPVTSVWTAGFAHAGNLQNPFEEIPGRALVRTFVKKAYAAYGNRWVWTFNPYPIWAGGLQPDVGNPHQCNNAIELTKGPIMADMIAYTRKAMKVVTGNDDDLLWAGEIGWSSPKSDGMNAGIFQCRNYTSLQTFSGYYQNFLEWDLSLSAATDPEDRNLKGVDKAFFFTMRDANNGASHEYFGLVEKCGEKSCKITTKQPKAGEAVVV